MLKAALVIILCFPGVAFCQASFGVKGGMNISDVVMTNFVNPDVESDLDLKLGIHAGVFLTGPVDDRIAMTAELLYSDKGVRSGTNIHLHYIAVPLLIQYKLGENLSAELGPEPAYLFSAMSDHGDVSGAYNSKFDVSLDGGLRFDVSKVTLGIRYCVGLFSVRDPLQIPGGSGPEKIKFQNRVVQFSVGYNLYSFE